MENNETIWGRIYRDSAKNEERFCNNLLSQNKPLSHGESFRTKKVASSDDQKMQIFVQVKKKLKTAGF